MCLEDSRVQTLSLLNYFMLVVRTTARNTVEDDKDAVSTTGKVRINLDPPQLCEHTAERSETIRCIVPIKGRGAVAFATPHRRLS